METAWPFLVSQAAIISPGTPTAKSLRCAGLMINQRSANALLLSRWAWKVLFSGGSADKTGKVAVVVEALEQVTAYPDCKYRHGVA